MALVMTYYTDEWRKRTSEILVDGEHLAEQALEKGSPPRFFDVEYRIPESLTRDKRTVDGALPGDNGSEIAAVFLVRTIRRGKVKTCRPC